MLNRYVLLPIGQRDGKARMSGFSPRIRAQKAVLYNVRRMGLKGRTATMEEIGND